MTDTPATEAGKALLDWDHTELVEYVREGSEGALRRAILAIEAESASAANARAERADGVVEKAVALIEDCGETEIWVPKDRSDSHLLRERLEALAAAVDAWTEEQRP